MNNSEFCAWFDTYIQRFTILNLLVVRLIEGLITREGIEFLSVNGRAKSRLSALSKLERKEYAHPDKEMTDICGIRVITFLDTQVTQIESILKEAFEVDILNTSDRSKILSEDKVGYRSIHIVATLGEKRSTLPEYKILHDLKFEIQIRTVLQHAWAELAHDRSFKFGIALPTPIQRKLNLHAGLLELVDNAFTEIAQEIDSYRRFVETQPFSSLLLEQIDEISLFTYVKYLTDRYSLNVRMHEIGTNAICELKDFGFKTIGDINQKVTERFIKAMTREEVNSTPNSAVGILRSIMMFSDLNKYFEYCWRKNWTMLTKYSITMLLTKYSQIDLDNICRAYDIEVIVIKNTVQ